MAHNTLLLPRQPSIPHHKPYLNAPHQQPQITTPPTTCMSQECIRYNSLLGVMHKSLKETVKALKGLVVMSPELEGVAYSMYDNQVRVCIACVCCSLV